MRIDVEITGTTYLLFPEDQAATRGYTVVPASAIHAAILQAAIRRRYLSTIKVVPKSISVCGQPYAFPPELPSKDRAARIHPALLPGWTATFFLEAHGDEDAVQDVLEYTGLFIGILSETPTYGRFHVSQFRRIH